ncbi:hypothetical protein Tco_0815108, partial [Tanacetum coccineum]
AYTYPPLPRVPLSYQTSACSLSTMHFLKFPENSVEVLKILDNKLESMKILENKLELLKLQENQPPNRRSIWSDILQAVNSLKDKGIDFLQFIRKKIGNGVNTSFWADSWIGSIPFKEKFPRLYALEESKSISVADKLGLSSLYLSFRRPPRGGIEQDSFNLLCQSVRGLVLSNIEDRWSWSLEGSGLFSVKSSRAYIDDLLLPKADAATRWIRILPIKINVFAWKIVTTIRYVVPTSRVNVPAGRYVVPTSRVNVPAGRYVVPTGKDNVIVSTGRTKLIPAGRTILVLKMNRAVGHEDGVLDNDSDHNLVVIVYMRTAGKIQERQSKKHNCFSLFMRISMADFNHLDDAMDIGWLSKPDLEVMMSP